MDFRSRQNEALKYFATGASAYRSGALVQAEKDMQTALEHDSNYSAAWKIYAKVLFELGRFNVARQACETGMEVAKLKGDMQALREIENIIKKIDKQTPST